MRWQVDSTVLAPPHRFCRVVCMPRNRPVSLTRFDEGFGRPSVACVAHLFALGAFPAAVAAAEPLQQFKSARAVAFAVTPPVTELANRPIQPPSNPRPDRRRFSLELVDEDGRRRTRRADPGAGAGRFERFVDPALPAGERKGAEVMPAPTSFPGISLISGSRLPPDAVGDVGPSHYVQMTNAMPTSGATGGGDLRQSDRRARQPRSSR